MNRNPGPDRTRLRRRASRFDLAEVVLGDPDPTVLEALCPPGARVIAARIPGLTRAGVYKKLEHLGIQAQGHPPKP